MSIFLSIIAFLLIFSALILIHEFGHFFAAKKLGVKVLEFGLGLPPKIWSFKPKNGDTLYSLNSIPFGGFVRLYGEDFTDKKAQKSKVSFVKKTVFAKSIIVCAGVFMNFLLAFVLLTFGFVVGMQPLLVSQNDVMKAIDDEIIKMQNGVFVSGVNDTVYEHFNNSLILSINGFPIGMGNDFSLIKNDQSVYLTYKKDGIISQSEIIWKTDNPPFVFREMIYLPRVHIFSVSRESMFYDLFKKGDYLLSINEQKIFDRDKFLSLISQDIAFEVDKMQIEMEGGFFSDFHGASGVVISDLVYDMGAWNSGLRPFDLIKEINGVTINSLVDTKKAIEERSGDNHVVTVLRNGNITVIYVPVDENALAGFFMSELEEINGVTFFMRSVPMSLKEISNVKYPVLQAPIVALNEMVRLILLTVQMLGQVFSQIFTQFSVPDGVSGPVGIAQMTHTFAQEGFMSLLRFTALLSLSLAIINLMPIPGLDGGRLLLIIISAIFAGKLNVKYEAWLNFFGFVLLMALLFFVTFNDLVRLFTG